MLVVLMAQQVLQTLQELSKLLLLLVLQACVARSAPMGPAAATEGGAALLTSAGLAMAKSCASSCEPRKVTRLRALLPAAPDGAPSTAAPNNAPSAGHSSSLLDMEKSSTQFPLPRLGWSSG